MRKEREKVGPCVSLYVDVRLFPPIRKELKEHGETCQPTRHLLPVARFCRFADTSTSTTRISPRNQTCPCIFHPPINLSLLENTYAVYPEEEREREREREKEKTDRHMLLNV